MSTDFRERVTKTFDRLYFSESVHREGGKCYIAKLKRDPVTGEKLNGGTLIVLSNASGSHSGGITFAGRWDVTCMEMKSGKGWIVLSASPTTDTLELQRGDFFVNVLVNGKRDKFVGEDGGVVPLDFNTDKWYEPKRIVPTIKRKALHLQLSPQFCLDTFCDGFLMLCAEVDKEYKYAQMQRSEATGSVAEVDVSKLQEKWGKN